MHSTRRRYYFLSWRYKVCNRVNEHFRYIFEVFWTQKPNKIKCEIAGIGALKGVQVALCSMRCIDLVFNTVKILGTYYSYNEKLEIQEKFKRHIIKIDKNFTNLENERSLNCGAKLLSLNSCNFKNSTSCISKNNSKFNYTRIKQSSKRIYMENSQS